MMDRVVGVHGFSQETFGRPFRRGQETRADREETGGAKAGEGAATRNKKPRGGMQGWTAGLPRRVAGGLANPGS